MKQRHKLTARLNALYILKNINANADQDFHTLTSDQVRKLLMEADHDRYKAPKNANGSRARYYFAKICREAKWQAQQ